MGLAGTGPMTWRCRKYAAGGAATYSPQLNPVEHIWDEIREKWFANEVFNSLDAVEDRLMIWIMKCGLSRGRHGIAQKRERGGLVKNEILR